MERSRELGRVIVGGTEGEATRAAKERAKTGGGRAEAGREGEGQERGSGPRW